MKPYHYLFAISLILVLLLAACSGKTEMSDVKVENTALSRQTEEVEEVMEEGQNSFTDMSEISGDPKAKEIGGTGEIIEEESVADKAAGSNDMGSEEGSSEMGSEAMSVPGYFSIEMIDASSGNPFRIKDYKSKVILVETLAMWCSNCFKQQNQVKALHDLIGEREDFVTLGLDIDPNENLEDLKGYIENNGFDWTYAVAPVEVAREISQLYGAQFLNPPSTPMFIIDREGEVHPLPFGVKGAEELQAALQPFLDEG